MILASIFLAATSAGAQTAFVNWESPSIHAVDITPNGSTLVAVNTADDKLEVFTLSNGLPAHVASIPVGLDPVSARARTNSEVWVVNRVSDSVSIVDLTSQNVIATLNVGDEPFDVVFAGNPQRAFVSVSQLNQVSVYDPANRAAPPLIVPILGKNPRALATDGARVFAAIFESGNRSMILPAATVSNPTSPYSGQNPPPNSGANFNPPIAAGLPVPPPTSLIVNKEGGNWKDDNNHIWDAFVTWNLNENDVAVIQTSNLTVTYAKDLLNLDMALAVNPVNGRVAVVGTYGPNEHRFEQASRVQFERNRIALFDPASNNQTNGVADLNPHLLLNPPFQPYKSSVTAAERHKSISDPRGIVWNTSGTATYVSGMSSNNVIKIDNQVNRLATIDVGQGPTGLVLDASRNRIYCLNRFDATVSVIDLTTDSEIGRVSFFDPTTSVIKLGRPFLYDSHATSSHGNAACAGCHVDAMMDTEAWDLGDPQGSLQTFDEACNTGLGFGAACNDWHPMKGPMMTQPLIGSIGTEPLHWRGDRPDLRAFRVGFTGLLGLSTPPTDPQLDQMRDFLATIRAQPNPYRTFTDGLPASINGFSGNPTNGALLFNSTAFVASAKCVDCHSASDGSGGFVVSPDILHQSQGINVPSLRMLYKKVGLSFSSTTNNRGFGFTHDGSADTIFSYLSRPQFNFPAGAVGDSQRRDLEAFLMAFPTDTHPAVGVQITFDGNNKNDANLMARLDAMTSLADSGAVGLVAKGLVGGLPRSYSFVAGTGQLQSDRVAELTDATSLRLSASAGGEITFTVVPIGTQVRVGIDRDTDGWYDRDELDAATDPADATSHPNGGPTDMDGDGVPDTIDNCVSTSNPSQADGDNDSIGDACDPCTNSVPVFALKSRVKIKNLLAPAGDETLKLSTRFTLPTTPAIDPASNGLRLILSASDGSTLADITVPPGAAWTQKPGKPSWKYVSTGNGITKLVLRGSPSSPGFFALALRGLGLDLPVTNPALPLGLTIVLDTPLATTGQCAEATFPGPAPLPRCAMAKNGITVVCK